MCRKDHVKIVDMIMQELSPEQQRWVIRIILKGTSSSIVCPQLSFRPISATDLKAGVREKTVLGAFHPQAIELFNVSSDLKRVCWTLADPHARLNEKVRLFASNTSSSADPNFETGSRSHPQPSVLTTTMQTSRLDGLGLCRKDDAAQAVFD
jgi:hypothetical protein